MQVQKRFRDWAGLLESYQVLLADEGTEDVPVEVPAEQVCMHFFPGSRVDVKGTPAQQVGASVNVSLLFRRGNGLCGTYDLLLLVNQLAITSTASACCMIVARCVCMCKDKHASGIQAGSSELLNSGALLATSFCLNMQCKLACLSSFVYSRLLYLSLFSQNMLPCRVRCCPSGTTPSTASTTSGWMRAAF